MQRAHCSLALPGSYVLCLKLSGHCVDLDRFNSVSSSDYCMLSSRMKKNFIRALIFLLSLGPILLGVCFGGMRLDELDQSVTTGPMALLYLVGYAQVPIH